MKIKGLKLKYYILFFYIVTGLFPLLLLTYYYLNTYVNSFVSDLSNRVENDFESIVTTMDNKVDNYKKIAYMISQLSIIKASLTEYLSPIKKDLLKTRLKEYADNLNFDAIEIVRKSSKPLIFVGIQDNKMVKFQTPIKDFNSSLLGYLNIYIKISKIVKPFLDYKIKGKVSLKKEVYYYGKILYKSAKTISDPLIYTKSLKSFPMQLNLLLDKKYIFNKYLFDITTVVTLIVLFILSAVVFSLYFLNWIMRPYSVLINSYKMVSEGKFDYRIKDKHSKEINFVYNQFNEMVEKLKETQNKMIQIEKLSSIGLMSASLAHEIKNPLASIKMGLAYLKRKANSDQIATLDIINEEVNRIDNTIQNLLKFSRPAKPNKVNFDIKNVIDECVNTLNYQLNIKNVKCICEVEDFTIKLDKDHFYQIVINLLTNALDAVGEKGEINIKGYKFEDSYVLKIIDNGDGISKEQLSKIYDPFFTTKHYGTGLGLSIVYRLCRENGIEFDILSKEGEGTEVILKISNGEDNV